jgi:hypothetical protein
MTKDELREKYEFMKNMSDEDIPKLLLFITFGIMELAILSRNKNPDTEPSLITFLRDAT